MSSSKANILNIIMILAAVGMGFSLSQFLLNNDAKDEQVIAEENLQAAPQVIENDSSSASENLDKEEEGDEEPYYMKDAQLQELLSKLNKPQTNEIEITSPGKHKVKAVSTALILDKPDGSTESYAKLLSSVENIDAALKKLRPATNELELVRLLSILDTVVGAWSGVPYGYDNQRILVINLLIEQWEEHAKLIAAANCIYCGSYFQMLTGLVHLKGLNDEWHDTALRIHPRFMQIADTVKPIDDELRIKLARIYSRLVSPGDANIAKYIAHVLLSNNDLNDYLFWSIHGLNGHNSVMAIDDFSAMPKDYLQNIWLSGASGGYVNHELTYHLLSTGYRPALRWLIWVLDGGAKYMQTHAFKYQSEKYIEVMTQYTDFPVQIGPELSEYYSNNWNNIVWHKESKKWITQ